MAPLHRVDPANAGNARPGRGEARIRAQRFLEQRQRPGRIAGSAAIEEEPSTLVALASVGGHRRNGDLRGRRHCNVGPVRNPCGQQGKGTDSERGRCEPPSPPRQADGVQRQRRRGHGPGSGIRWSEGCNLRHWVARIRGRIRVEPADEAITATREGLDVARVFGMVIECRAQPAHRAVQRRVEIDDHAVGPETRDHLLTGHQLSRARQQFFEHLEGLPLQPRAHVSTHEFAGRAQQSPTVKADLVAHGSGEITPTLTRS